MQYYTIFHNEPSLNPQSFMICWMNQRASDLSLNKSFPFPIQHSIAGPQRVTYDINKVDVAANGLS